MCVRGRSIISHRIEPQSCNNKLLFQAEMSHQIALKVRLKEKSCQWNELKVMLL